MTESVFRLAEPQYRALQEPGGTLSEGLVMDRMEGVWLAWATDDDFLRRLESGRSHTTQQGDLS